MRIIGVAMSLGLYITHLKRGVVTSGALFLFWFLETILGVITFRSVLMSGHVIGEELITPFTNYAIQYPLIVAMFFLTCWADPKPKYINMDGK